MGKTTGSESVRVDVIARLNDQLRTTGVGGTVMTTYSVQRITGFESAVLAAELATYNEFGLTNDPHGERDFGAMTLWGYDLLWKIDYYDKTVNVGSDDPANPHATRRVLTVMLASEW